MKTQGLNTVGGNEGMGNRREIQLGLNKMARSKNTEHRTEDRQSKTGNAK